MYIKKGEQPKVDNLPFYPDAAQPYLSEIEAKELFGRFETICQKTGFPRFPMLLFPFLLAPILIYMITQDFNNSTIIGVGVTIGVLFFLSAISLWIMARIRKSQVTALFEEWNQTEGVPKGLFFRLGDPSGPSEDKFWNGIYPMTINIVDNDTLTILTEYVYNPDNSVVNVSIFSPVIYLYMNPSARQEWCRRNGVEFVEQVGKRTEIFFLIQI